LNLILFLFDELAEKKIFTPTGNRTIVLPLNFLKILKNNDIFLKQWKAFLSFLKGINNKFEFFHKKNNIKHKI